MAQEISCGFPLEWLDEEEDLRDPDEMELVLENPDEEVAVAPAVRDEAEEDESLAEDIPAALHADEETVVEEESEESDEDDDEDAEIPPTLSAEELAANEISLEADLWDALRPTFIRNEDEASSVESDEDDDEEVPRPRVVEEPVEPVKSPEDKEKVAFGNGALLTGAALEALAADFQARLGKHIAPTSAGLATSRPPPSRDAALETRTSVQHLLTVVDEGTPAQDTGLVLSSDGEEGMEAAVTEDKMTDLDAADSLFGDGPDDEGPCVPGSPVQDSAYASGDNKAGEDDLHADMDVPSPVGEQVTPPVAVPEVGDAVEGDRTPEANLEASVDLFSFSPNALGSPIASPGRGDPAPLPAELGHWEPFDINDFDPATEEFRPGTASAAPWNPATAITGLALPAVALPPMTAEQRQTEEQAMLEAMGDLVPGMQQPQNPVPEPTPQGLQAAEVPTAAAPAPVPAQIRPRAPEVRPHPAPGNPVIDLEGLLDHDWIDEARLNGRWGPYNPKAMLQPQYIYAHACPFDERNPRMMYDYMQAVLVAKLAPWQNKGINRLPSRAATWWFGQAQTKFMRGVWAKEHLAQHLPHELWAEKRKYWPLFMQERGLDLLSAGYLGQEAVDWIAKTLTALGEVAAAMPPDQRGAAVPDICVSEARVAAQDQPAQPQHWQQQPGPQLPQQQQAERNGGVQQGNGVRTGRVERRRAPNAQQRRGHLQQAQRAAAAGQLIMID